MPGELIAAGAELEHAIHVLGESSHHLAEAVAGLSTMAKRLQQQIPAWVVEWGQSNAGDTAAVVTPATRQLERISSILVSLPSGTTSASLTLGEITIPNLAAGITTIANVGFLLRHFDRRVLTYAPAGEALVVLMGEQQADQGFLDGARA